MALTNFTNCFSILGGPFSGAHDLRVLGSSCELLFCQYIRIWGFIFNLWAYCRHVKMALTNFINFFPQQRKLKGSSAQISSGVFRRGSQEQVPEAGSGRFRRVPMCADVGSGGRFRRVPVCAGGSGEFRCVCWCRFWRQVPEGSGEFWCVLV